MNRLSLLVLALASLLLAAPVLGEVPLLIDFEHFPGPDGVLGTADDVPAPSCPHGFCDRITSEYAALGLLFNSGDLGQGDLFPDAGAANHFVTSTPLDVTLSKDVFSVSVDSYSYWPAVLWAFDAQGRLIGTATLSHPHPGQEPRSGVLSLVSGRAIRRFTVRAEGCAPDGVCDHILNLDNLRLLLEIPEPPAGAWLASTQVPGFQFKVRITDPKGQVVASHQETACLPETLCVSGAIPGRAEVLLRVLGPRPNGYLWPTLTKLSASQFEIWVQQTSTGVIKYYVLPGATPSDDTLPGLFDRYGFLP